MSMWGGTPARRISPSRQDRLFKTNLIRENASIESQLATARQQLADRCYELSALKSELQSAQEEIKRLQDHISAPTVAGKARHIAAEVAAEFGLTFFDMISQCRNRTLVMARKKAMWRIKKECSHMSLPMIGRLFGDRDHTTALHGIRDYQKHVDAGSAW